MAKTASHVLSAAAIGLNGLRIQGASRWRIGSISWEPAAQKLAKALKACRSFQSKHKRLQCEKTAKKKYAKPKKKTKKR